MSAPNAWEVEDGDGTYGIENPQTWTEVGEAILALYDAETVTRLILDSNDDGTGLVEWDFSDPGQLGYWLYEGITPWACAWHMPTEVYKSISDTAWQTAYEKGLIRTHQSWYLPAPEGYTRIVWVTL